MALLKVDGLVRFMDDKRMGKRIVKVFACKSVSQAIEAAGEGLKQSSGAYKEESDVLQRYKRGQERHGRVGHQGWVVMRLRPFAVPGSHLTLRLVCACGMQSCLWQGPLSKTRLWSPRLVRLFCVWVWDVRAMVGAHYRYCCHRHFRIGPESEPVGFQHRSVASAPHGFLRYDGRVLSPVAVLSFS
jgi:hypothetical protein